MKHTYRIVEGAHWRKAPAGSDERMICYRAGDTIQMTEAEAKELGDGSGNSRKYVEYVIQSLPAPPEVAKPPVAKVAPESVQPTPADSAGSGDLSDLPWQTVKVRVAEMQSKDEVLAVLEAEEAGKNRQSVLDACHARLAELVG